MFVGRQERRELTRRLRQTFHARTVSGDLVRRLKAMPVELRARGRRARSVAKAESAVRNDGTNCTRANAASFQAAAQRSAVRHPTAFGSPACNSGTARELLNFLSSPQVGRDAAHILTLDFH